MRVFVIPSAELDIHFPYRLSLMWSPQLSLSGALGARVNQNVE